MVGTNAKARSEVKLRLFLLLYCFWMNLRPISTSKSHATYNFLLTAPVPSALLMQFEIVFLPDITLTMLTLSQRFRMSRKSFFNRPVNMSKVIKTIRKTSLIYHSQPR
jgi:hypothetical protein